MSRSAPTTTRRASWEMSPNGGQSAAITSDHATSAAPTPMRVELLWRLTPTARTMVNASTISTVDARNAETTRNTAPVARAGMSCYLLCLVISYQLSAISYQLTADC